MAVVRISLSRLVSIVYRCVAVAVVTMAALICASNASLAEGDTPFSDTDAKLASVTVVPATWKEVVGRTPISGTLVPLNEVLVYPEINGVTIDSLLVDIGDLVEKGMLIATLNDRTLRSQLKQAEAELARAEAAVGQARSQISAADAGATQANSALARMEQLLQSGTTTQSALDQAIANAHTADANLASAKDGLSVANAQLLQALAALEIARINLERASIHAPASGIISARNGQIGAIASSAGEPIFRIIENSDVELEAEVIETALGDINFGDLADLEIAGIGPSTGVVRRLSPTVNARNRLGVVRITINSDKFLRPGLFASGWIVTARRQSITVPAAAVLTDQGGTYVLVSNDGTLSKRVVVAGLIWNRWREIVSGVSLDELVVAKAGAFFADGDRINPVRTEESEG